MSIEYTKPFVDSASKVFLTMTQTQIEAGTPVVKDGVRAFGSVTGILGLSGSGVSGNMILSFEAPCILKIVSNMLYEEFTSLTSDVVDAVGELTNMICGGAKSDLAEMGITLDMSTPVVVQGENVELTQLCKTPTISVPCLTPNGRFVIEINLTKN